jgi:spore coat polysaccharide biosynthesis protein SpsF
MVIVAIIQARMGSTRLPGKVMMDLCGNPVLWHVVKRVSASNRLNWVVVATSTAKEDNIIENFCNRTNIMVFRGDATNVLSRYYECAKYLIGKGHNIQYIVRITADCPLIDPAIIDKVIHLAVSEKLDFASNVHPITYPDGLDVEVFTFEALSEAYHNATLPSEKEHVTPYIIKNPHFRQGNVKNTVDISGYQNLRWTLDYDADYFFIKLVYKYLYPHSYCGRCFLMEDVLQLMKEKPELLLINTHIPANEGYQKSLQEDEKFLRG